MRTNVPPDKDVTTNYIIDAGHGGWFGLDRTPKWRGALSTGGLTRTCILVLETFFFS